jgi:Ankyrin repeats (many copies)
VAARYGHTGAVTLLLGHSDIQVNLVDKYGWSALIMVAWDGREYFIRRACNLASLIKRPTRLLEHELCDNRQWLPGFEGMGTHHRELCALTNKFALEPILVSPENDQTN